MKKIITKRVCFAALGTAIIAICAQLCIPIGPLVITLQVFGVALCGFAYGVKGSLFSVSAYLLLGVAGAPVFAAMKGGLSVLMGPSGGFLWGFLPLSVCCAVAFQKKNAGGFLIVLAGLLLCYTCGNLQLLLVTNLPIQMMAMQLVCLLKDLVLIWAAYNVAKLLREHNIL